MPSVLHIEIDGYFSICWGVICRVELHCVYYVYVYVYMLCVCVCREKITLCVLYARDGEDTAGMGDRLIPTSEMLPKHLHIKEVA